VVHKLRIFALGGNEIAPVAAVDQNGKTRNPDIAEQWRRSAITCDALAAIIAAAPCTHHVITHGNGPQIGNILLRAELALPVLHPLPLDICGADSQGALGYMLAQLNNSFQNLGVHKSAAGVITCCEVDADDPAFKEPTKFIGPSYSECEAEEKRKALGWKMKPYKKTADGGQLWRRVVPSPAPQGIRELPAILALLGAGIVPIACGGGGIPITRARVRPLGDDKMVYDCNYGIEYQRVKHLAPAQLHRGVEAVIDKDLASAMLGRLLKGALQEGLGQKVESELFILTDVDGVRLNYQKPDEKYLPSLTLTEARHYQREGHFAAGSMGPKVAACIDFIAGGGDRAYISNMAVFTETLAGTRGTVFIKE
jgi:carbamate kinase